MRSCDVLIVGAGPAGSSCAWGLRETGLDVVVLDRSVFPRDKICGGWITPFVLDSLSIDPLEYARGRTLQPISAFRVGCFGQKEQLLEYDDVVSYGIRRREFDEYLMRRCGAEVREGVQVTTIKRAAGQWIVNGEFQARLLVGAAGHFCPVSRILGRGGKENPVVAQEIEFAMSHDQARTCAIAPEIPELFFCRDMRGYGWCFRKGNFLNIGLGRLDPHGLSEQVQRFVRFLGDSGKIAFEVPGRMAGHAYLLFGYSPRKIVDDGLLLIGDSAGLAYAQSGEGIRPAIESGLMAAAAITAAEGLFSAERLQVYSELLEQRFAAGRKIMQSLAMHIPVPARNALGRMLLKSRRFCRSVVVEDWFLHIHDTPLAPVRSLKRGVPEGHPAG